MTENVKEMLIMISAGLIAIFMITDCSKKVWIMQPKQQVEQPK